ncbi:MAG: zf-HC2 domain-containing protein [bacterium]|nr:zf-HC2 domain-containing protein [bacterium]
MTSRPLPQPPNPDDLQRHPPQSATCARMRGLMRDFVDRELLPAEAAALEEHVHGCRDCGLALGRSEHERLLVRRVFPATSTTAPAGFAAGVMGRLLSEGLVDETELEQVELSESGLSETGLSETGLSESGAANADAAGAVGQATRGRRRGGVLAGARFLVSLPGVLMVAIMVLAGLVLVQGFQSAANEPRPERIARLVITSSVDTHGMFGQKQVRLQSGDGLGDEQLVWVGAGGAAQADWHDKSERRQPAATFQLDGNAAVRLDNGEPVLVNGQLQVEARRPFGLAVADGSRLELLGKGEYVLSAQSAAGSRWDPSRGAPVDLRVSVEVMHGDGVRIQREDAPPIFVGAGSVATYAAGEISVRTPVAADVRSRGDAPNTADAGPGSFQGVVWERSGPAAVGAEVFVSYRHGLAMHSTHATVAQTGIFAFDTGLGGLSPNCDSSFAVLKVMPPSHRPELGLVPPQAFQVGLNGRHGRLHDSVVLDASPLLDGHVLSGGRPVAGARVLPLVIDEVFSTVLAWPEGQVMTSETGQYSLSRLPAELPRHQRLALIVLHPSHEPKVVTVPVRGSEHRLHFDGQIDLSPMQSVTLHTLPQEQEVEIWQDVPGLPPGSCARLHTVQTDPVGKVPAMLLGGEGAIYMRRTDSTHGKLRRLVLDSPVGRPSYRPAPGASIPFGDVYEMEQVLPGTGLALASSYRHQRIASTAPAQATLDLYFTDDLTGGIVPDAQVFAIEPGAARGRSRVRFLGFSSMGGGLGYDIQAEDLGIFVIASNGATAIVELGSLLENRGWVRLPATGRVLVDRSLRPAVGSPQGASMLRLEAVDAGLGLQPVHHRFASSASGWEALDLPPGEYRVTLNGRTFPIEVVAGNTVVLR